MERAEWGTKEWFEQMCDPAYADSLGDSWGHRWRGLQKFRYAQYLNLLKPILSQNERQLDILDIGCAFGDFTEKVWKLNPQNNIWGIDISENAIKVASRRLPQLRFKVSALPDLDFADNSFDLIFCLSVLYYLDRDEKEKSLGSIKRVLKPNGYLFLSGPLSGGKRYFDKEEILTLISKSGFQIEKVQYSYNRLYLFIERKFLSLLDRTVLVQKAIKISDKEYLQWLKDKQSGGKLVLVNLTRKVVNTIPLGQKFIGKLLQISERMLRRFIFSEAIPAFFNLLTKFLLGGRGTGSITILAKVGNS